MDNAGWDRIQELFHAAADLSIAERPAFLRTACGTDEALRQSVQSMLDEDARGASLFDHDLAEVAGKLIGSSDPASIPSDKFDPYNIVRLLGEGGMGVVYLARRKDLGSVVAIKILRDAWLTPARREQFSMEQRLLAQLNHPCIARLYDADVLPDGTPWFVMEYVEGVPLTSYCSVHACSIERRLQLFRAVCEAVQYAHEQAVIHRDLKPSNILVKHDGSIRLLDFGIAKQIESLDASPEQTLAGLRLMTPAYASPEQIHGRRVSIQTDVYSLGVILFELLAGELPFDLSTLTPQEAMLILASHEPASPSSLAKRRAESSGASVPHPAIGRQAWADLDVLCLTAMHKDPHRRYRSVEALIRDIDHYLHGEPLEARPDSLRYRSTKFIRRNSHAVAAAAAVLLVVVGLVTFFTVRLTHARDAALSEAARTERVQSFMMNLFEGGDEAAGPSAEMRVVTLVQKGVQEASAMNRDPKIQAEMFLTLGSVYEKLGKLDDADSLMQKALAQRKRIFGLQSAEVAETLVALSQLRADQAHFDEAEQMARQAIAIDTSVLPPEHPALASATSQLGLVLEDRGAYSEAIPVLERAVQLQSAPGGVKADLSSSLTELANSHYYAGHYDISDSLNRRVLELDKQLYGERHPQVANDLINLGAIQLDQGHYAEAERYDRQALDILQSFYGKDNAETASAMTLLGRTLVTAGKDSDAAQMLEDALATEERIYGAVHPRIASTLNELGKIALKQGKLDQARADFSRMAEIYRRIYNGKHYYIGIALSNLSSVYMKEKKYGEAEKLMRETLQIYARTLSPDHLNVGIARIRLGRILLQQKRDTEAEIESRAGYEIVSKQNEPPASWLGNARTDLVAEYKALNQPQKAAELFSEPTAIPAADSANSR